MMAAKWSRRQRQLIGLQGAYYLLTGLWPLVHLPRFEAVTGPKVDDWLVHMVGLLAVVIGGTLALGTANGRSSTLEVIVLASSSALAFAGIDLWYGLKGQISPVYLADALVELVFVGLIALTAFKRARGLVMPLTDS